MQRHRRRLLLVQQIQQAIARFADVAAAQRNVGEKRHQRRLPRVRQHDGLVVAAQLQRAAQLPALAQLQRAVAERRRDHFPHLGHAPRDRRHPLRREQIDLDAGQFLAQAGEKGLRHEGVADPAGCDDEDAGQTLSDLLRVRPYRRTSSRSTGRALRAPWRRRGTRADGATRAELPAAGNAMAGPSASPRPGGRCRCSPFFCRHRS